MIYKVNDEDMKFIRFCLVCVIYDLYEVNSLTWLRYKLLEVYNKYI